MLLYCLNFEQLLANKDNGLGHGCHEGGAGGCSGPPLESELSFICIGFSLINDVRARVWPPPGKGGPPPGKFSGDTHGLNKCIPSVQLCSTTVRNFVGLVQITPLSIDVTKQKLSFMREAYF